MNCTHAKDALLLRSSGEIDAASTRPLQAHLGECAECRSYAADLDVIFQAEQASRPAGDARDEVVAGILRHAAPRKAADRSGPRRSLAEDLFALWRPALIYGVAALLMLFLSLRMLKKEAPAVAHAPPAASEAAAPELAWDPDLESQISELDTLMVSAFSDVGPEGAGNGDASLDDLAAELLELEGWNI